MKPDRIVYLSDQPGHTSLFNSLRGQFGGELVVFPNDAPDFTQVSKFENSLVFAGSSINAKGWNNIFRELEKSKTVFFQLLIR